MLQQTVHFPANPNRFEFDAEVAKVFPDMAARSIPNFHLAHEVHVAIARGHLQKPGCRVLDVGASRGHFLAEMKRQGHSGYHYEAVDASAPMCTLLAADHPEVTVTHADITSHEFAERLSRERFDIVCCNYVLQFLPKAQQLRALHHLTNSVADGGLFFLGHKTQHYGELGELAHERYIDFRIRNGYTREEILAKTEALKGSMFPMHEGTVRTFLRAGFSDVQETTRFMMFSTVAARK